MKRFLVRIIFFAAVCYLSGEIVVRSFKLVPDIPQRFIDDSGIQRYVPKQSGYYTKATSKWTVNDYGWLGVSETDKDTIISVIGDSYIENIMNPDSCNQGSILSSNFPDYGFFEAGRSGVSFMETMEITKLLDSTISPTHHLVYVSQSDFEESFADKNRYTDRIQFDSEKQQVLKANLKSSVLKSFLYNTKFLYYLYLRFPIFVDQQNQGEVNTLKNKKKSLNGAMYKDIFEFVVKNYEIRPMVLVFHPNTNTQIIEMAQEYGLKTIALKIRKEKSWALGEHDGHWSCYGHNQAAQQVKEYLLENL